MGAGGNDVLTGGAQGDTFIFQGNWGADSVADFQNGLDLLDLRGTGLSFAGLTIGAADVDRDGAFDDALIDAAAAAPSASPTSTPPLSTASDFLF